MVSLTREQETELENMLSLLTSDINEFSGFIVSAKNLISKPSYTRLITTVEAAEQDILSIRQQFTLNKSQLEDEIALVEGRLSEVYNTTASEINVIMQASISNFESALDRLESINEEVENTKMLLVDVSQIKDDVLESFKSTITSAEDYASNLAQTARASFEQIVDTVDMHVESIDAEIDRFLMSTQGFLKNRIDIPLQEQAKFIADQQEILQEFLREVVMNQYIEALNQNILLELEARIGELVSHLQSLVQVLAEQMISGNEETEKQQVLLREATQVIESVVDPVLSALDNIRSLGSSVGISV